MDDEDEDVDLEHSPLYKYSQDLGLEEDPVQALQEEGPAVASFWDRLLDKFALVKQQLLGPLNVNFSRKSIRQALIAYYLVLHGKTILNSRALMEEDADFLENMFPATTGDLPPNIYLPANLKRFLLPATLLISYACAKCHLEMLSYGSKGAFIAESAFVVGLSGYALTQVIMLLGLWKMKRDFHDCLSNLNECIGQCESFSRSVLKSIGHVQELEVIGRGLLLYPLRKEIDNGNYVAFMNDTEFGPVLVTDVPDDEELLNHEDISVSTIKSLGQLFGVQLSEFLRRLALCFYPDFVVESKDVNLEDCFRIVLPIIKSGSLKLRHASMTLTNSLNFHRKIAGVGRHPSLHRESSSVIQSAMSSRAALVTAIKSLSLHLQVSLARIQDFNDSLETFDDFTDSQNPTQKLSLDDYTVLNDQLELVNKDLQACMACWDESALRLKKLGPVQEKCEAVLIPVPMPSGNATLGIPLLDRTDIAPEDQVFEAYVDRNEDLAETEDGSWDLELRRKTLEDRAISKRMFSELKTVLVSKAEEWQEREARALLNSGVAVQETASREFLDTETSDTSLTTMKLTSFEENTTESGDILQPPFSNFNSSIASMAAARSRMLNLATCTGNETFGEEYSDSDTCSDT